MDLLFSSEDKRSHATRADAEKQKHGAHDASYLTKQTTFTSRDGLGYNLRLIQYDNGSAQIRLYNDFVSTQKYSKQKISSKSIIEPFDGKRVAIVEDFDDISYRSIESRKNSLARTRKQIMGYARSTCWEWFCTFTFAPSRSERDNYGHCCRQMCTWLKNIRDRKAPDLQYLAVPELHKDLTTWHFHVLLANTGSLVFTNSGHIKNGKKIYNVPGWRQGFSTATIVEDTYRIQNYVIKYMTKACHLLSQGEHRYFVSHGLPKPKESLFLVDQAEIKDVIEMITNSLGMEISFQKYVEGYLGITYFELQPTKTVEQKNQRVNK